jgi:hypothetical protein
MANPAIYVMYSNIILDALSVSKIKLNKCRRDFMIEIFMLYLSILSRINFLQLGRYSAYGEQRFRRQFEKRFNFFGFNKALSMPWIGSRIAVDFDPSFIHKSGKKTPGIGYFWSGCAGGALRGIEILGLSVIDAETRLSFHLDAVQSPPTTCLQDSDLSLIDWYSGVISGLENSQARSGNKLNFHFNAALTTVNIAKIMQLSNPQTRENSFSMATYKILFHNTLLLSRFFSLFAINPNSIKNRQHVNELLYFGTMAA